MNGQEIQAAVEKLHETYPLEIVQIWAGYNAVGQECYTARVGEYGEIFPMMHENGDRPMIAAVKLIATAGKRDKMAFADAKIAKLRKELAELEAKQTVEA